MRISRVQREFCRFLLSHETLMAGSLSSVKLSVPFYCKALSSQHPLKCHQLSEANWVMCAKRNSELIKLICRHTHRGKERAAINSNLRLAWLWLFALATALSHYFSWKRCSLFNCQIDALNINFNYRWMKYLTID